MPISHLWQYRYRAPIPGGQTINGQKPGENIARALTEIQDVIDQLLGQDGKGDEVPTKDEVDGMLVDEAAGVADYKVKQAQGGKAVYDYVRATA